jgi:hypothetical protein
MQPVHNALPEDDDEFDEDDDDEFESDDEDDEEDADGEEEVWQVSPDGGRSR